MPEKNLNIISGESKEGIMGGISEGIDVRNPGEIEIPGKINKGISKEIP